MKVLFLNPVGVLGGAEQSLMELLKSLQNETKELQVHLNLGGEGPLYGKSVSLGVATTVISIPTALQQSGEGNLQALLRRVLDPGSYWRSGLAREFLNYRNRLSNLVRVERPDLIHTNGMKSHLIASFLFGGRIPVIWHMRDFVGERKVAKRLLQVMQGRASGIIANSRAVARDARKVLGRRPTSVVYNAIDFRRFSPGLSETAWLDAEASFSTSPSRMLRVGLVGTYARWKGHEIFLKAAGRLLRDPSMPPTRFYVIGGPIYATGGSQHTRGELEEFIGDPEVRKQVGFVAFQEDTARCYRSLDIVVHASTRPEPFGRTIAEAMACGRAVIASTTGGASEIYSHLKDAFAVPPGDSGLLADAIKLLCLDDSLRARLASAAPASVGSRFPEEVSRLALFSVYRSVLARRAEVVSI